MTGRIFISYRREDEQGFAVRLYERLSEALGRENIFFDVDSIPPGFDFVEYIESQIQLSDIVLVVMGRNWLNAMDDNGQRRLDNPEDFVRVEIEAALHKKKHVIPILVQGAKMPPSTELPASLRPLARRNAVFATHVGFRAETERLLEQIKAIGLRLTSEAAARTASEAEAAAKAKAAEAELQRLRREEEAAKIAAARKKPAPSLAAIEAGSSIPTDEFQTPLVTTAPKTLSARRRTYLTKAGSLGALGLALGGLAWMQYAASERAAEEHAAAVEAAQPKPAPQEEAGQPEPAKPPPASPPAEAKPPAPADKPNPFAGTAIDRFLNDAIRARLTGYEASKTAALARAEAEAPAADLAPVKALLAKPLQPFWTPDLVGKWRCRATEMSELLALVTYDWFDCLVSEGAGLTFQKTSGSKRTIGGLHLMIGEQMAYLGTSYFADDAVPADGATVNDAGFAFRTGPAEWRIEFPGKEGDGSLQILEMKR